MQTTSLFIILSCWMPQWWVITVVIVVIYYEGLVTSIVPTIKCSHLFTWGFALFIKSFKEYFHTIPGLKSLI